ncbi:MAG TPA: sensor histidine kinase [Chloroflexota bacterium]|jgi:two-component system sensor histidine kinase UhpB|nr:sensor histidine kinase [Chloroflexota bacterium]
MRDWLLSLPIIHKVLFANTAIVVLGAVGGTWLTLTISRSRPNADHWELYVAFATLGVVASVAVNYLVLQAAFAPLIALVRTVSEVQNGNVEARAPRSATSDPRMEQLRETLNGMLDALASYRGRLRALSSQVITAQEEERKRISRELHDETAQALTLLLIRLKLLQNARDLAEVRTGAAELRELTARTLEEVRKLALELRPTTLDHLGLVAALEWYSREFAQRIGAAVDVHVEGLAGRLHPEVELVVYRVVQEALTNIARHAAASHVDVRLKFGDDAVEVAIEDDGRGFDAASAASTRERGLGLFGMRERVELIGGTISIDSRVGHGTRIQVRVPHTAWSDELISKSTTVFAGAAV